MVVLVGKQRWNNRRVDDRKCQRAELTIYKDVCRVVGRKFTGVGKPHDKFANDDVYTCE